MNSVGDTSAIESNASAKGSRGDSVSAMMAGPMRRLGVMLSVGAGPAFAVYHAAYASHKMWEKPLTRGTIPRDRVIIRGPMGATGGDEQARAPARFPSEFESKFAEAGYRALLRNFPNSAIIVCDRELRFVLVDGPELAATGFSKETMEGRTIYEALPAAFATLVERNMRRVLAGDEFSAELPFGDRIYLYNYVPVRDDDGQIVYGVIVATNVTQHRLVEAALKRSEERFERIFHATPEAIGVTRAADGSFIEVNPAFERAFGWSRDELLGKTTTELGMWVDPGRREAIVASLMETGHVDSIETPVQRKDGSLLDGLISLSVVELEGEPCVFFVFRDDTERMRAVRALAASEARLRSLSEAAFEGIAITENGIVIDVNDQIATMFRTTREAIIGVPVISFVAPESVDAVRSQMQNDTGQAYEHLSIRPDGSIFPVEVRGRRAENLGSAVRITAIRDITQRKKDEAERERLIAELRARNAEMEQFAYTVSHDLKSPLVTINGFVGMVERDLSEGDPFRIKADVARIGSAASKMMRLLNDVLELSRVGRVSQLKESVSLREVVREALELVAGPVETRKVRVVVSEALPEVVGDRSRLVQVVQNLIENAVKYMGDQPEPVVEIGVRPDAHSAVCFVRDNGIGIKPAHAERIFGLFEKLEPKSEGTGVGLALVRRILEYHGGGIAVESDGANGSTFVFHLPAPEKNGNREGTGHGTSNAAR
jgi:two-component system sensor kinase FixL